MLAQPFARFLAAPVDLRFTETPGNKIAVVACIIIAQLLGDEEPFVGLGLVLFDALARVIHCAKVIQRDWIALIRR